MSFGDETQEPHRPTHLVFRCRRCEHFIEEAHSDVDVALRRAIETGDLLRVHACSDGASGAAELYGTGPARPFAWRERAA